MSRLNIYDIDVWTANSTYLINDIIKYQNNYYYGLTNHTSDALRPPQTNMTDWGGMSNYFDGTAKATFIWQPSYNLSIDNNPIIKSIKFGDGYEQRLKDGINNNLLSLDVSFENRTLKEFTAIAHFLTARQGYIAFLFIPPRPFDFQKLFVCRTWNEVINFYNNYSIKAKFEEVVN